MAFKILGTTVLDDSRVLKNITIASATFNDFHPTVSTATTVIDFNNPVHKVDMTGSVTFTESNKAEGRTTLLILDTTASNHLPNFSGNVVWVNDFEPGWNAHRFWHVTLICWNSTSVVASAIGYDGSAGSSTPIPTGSILARQAAVGLAASTDDDDYQNDGSPASASSSLTFTLSRDAGSAFKITVRAGSGDTAGWTDAAGASFTLTTSEVTIYTNSNVTPEAIRITGSGGYDSGWVSTPTDLISVQASITASAATGGGTGTDSANSGAVTYQFYGRASGYADTLLVTYSGQATAYAETTGCFVGPSQVLLTDGISIWTDSIASLYDQYEAGSIAASVVGNDNHNNQIIEVRKHVGTRRLYGFNGSENFVTGAHPFLTTTGWKSANGEAGAAMHPELNITQLEVGDILVKYDRNSGEYYNEELLSITQETREENVYSLDVSGEHFDPAGNDTYVVDEYVVHNK